MERLQKVLAAAGIASRRKCEELISAGRVKVNGEVVTVLGTKVLARDAIEVDGQSIDAEPMVYYLLNKPSGYITTVIDTHARRKVIDLIPDYPRVYPVGRLDLDTEGLLLLTNDGDLTNALLHPSSVIDKVYRVTATGSIQASSLKALERGIELDDGKTAPAKVKLVDRREVRTVLEITIHEGRKRQVKRMLDTLGHRVINLERIAFAFLNLSGLERGKYRLLTDQEIQGLKNITKK